MSLRQSVGSQAALGRLSSGAAGSLLATGVLCSSSGGGLKSMTLNSLCGSRALKTATSSGLLKLNVQTFSRSAACAWNGAANSSTTNAQALCLERPFPVAVSMPVGNSRFKRVSEPAELDGRLSSRPRSLVVRMLRKEER